MRGLSAEGEEEKDGGGWIDSPPLRDHNFSNIPLHAHSSPVSTFFSLIRSFLKAHFQLRKRPGDFCGIGVLFLTEKKKYTCLPPQLEGRIKKFLINRKDEHKRKTERLVLQRLPALLKVFHQNVPAAAKTLSRGIRRCLSSFLPSCFSGCRH